MRFISFHIHVCKSKCDLSFSRCIYISVTSVGSALRPHGYLMLTWSLFPWHFLTSSHARYGKSRTNQLILHQIICFWEMFLKLCVRVVFQPFLPPCNCSSIWTCQPSASHRRNVLPQGCTTASSSAAETISNNHPKLSKAKADVDIDQPPGGSSAGHIL